jgi:dihydrofolate synthase/folylpolyglutamate synthase
MAVLGDTLAKIAGEKAGIIKRGVPVVSAPQKDEALEVLERVANLENCEFTLIGKDIMYESISHSLDGQVVSIRRRWSSRTKSISRPAAYSTTVQIPLLGSHQLENAATAYTALKVSGLEISDEAIQKGFARVKWRGRFEVARRDPPVIFDSAHNDDSFAKLRETLESYFPNKQAYLIFGASEDKNIPGMIAELKPKIRRLIVTRADHPRALEEEKIIELARQAEIESEAATPVESALRRALELSAKDGSIVLSAGSMFVTAEVMKAWQELMSLRGR